MNRVAGACARERARARVRMCACLSVYLWCIRSRVAPRFLVRRRPSLQPSSRFHFAACVCVVRLFPVYPLASRVFVLSLSLSRFPLDLDLDPRYGLMAVIVAYFWFLVGA